MKKIVCIGNSITNGFPFKRSQSFPSLIRAATGFEVINKGINGETTADVMARFKHDVIDHKPDLVTILTGTNDFIFSLDTTRGAFDKIKDMVSTAEVHGIKVILMTPLLTNPEMAKATWMTGAEIDYYKVNEQLVELGVLIKEYGINKEIGVLDIQSLYHNFEKKVGTENAFHDGLHPTVEGQAFIADHLLKVFQF
jgi:lysophospholipase L1-like esterase